METLSCSPYARLQSDMLPGGADSKPRVAVEMSRSTVSGYENHRCKGPEERGRGAGWWMEMKRAQCLWHCWLSELMSECLSER